MGVIHKLRGEVVSFVISLKMDNPSLGVRKLALLTSEKFKMKVSKSSINNVLKEAQLSSSVGRRPGSSVKPEKFSIPEDKKKQISENMRKAGFEKKKDAIIEEEKPACKKEIKPGEVKQEIPETEEAQEKIQEKEPDAQEKTGDAVLIRDQGPVREEPIINGAGFVFLNAAQWDISEKSLIAELLGRHINKAASERPDSACDVFAFLKFLGIDTLDHALDYKKHGLWALNDFCFPPPKGQEDLLRLKGLFEWDRKMRQSSSMAGLSLEYNEIKEQALLEIKGFKLFLEDGASLIINASMNSFGSGFDQDAGVDTVPIRKAMTRLSNSLISNIQSAVFYKAPGRDHLHGAFYEMVEVFENTSGKRIVKAGVIDKDDQEIADFTTIPFQKRTMIIGVSPEQREFSEFTKAAKWTGKRQFRHPETGATLYFAGTRSDFLASKISGNIADYRVITLWKDKEGDPSWMILTNQKGNDDEAILRSYLTHWPYIGEPSEAEAFDNKKSPQGQEGDQRKKDNENLWIYDDFVESLHQYSQRCFFPRTYDKIPVSHLLTSIYGVPGSVRCTKDSLKVSLQATEESTYHDDLVYAAKKINERCIFDYAGRRLWLDICLSQ